MSLLEMKQLFMWLLQKIVKITGKWISRSIFWEKHGRLQATLWTVIAQVCMYCIVMHEICMASYPQLASLATYEFDSTIFRLNLGNLLYNVVFISEHGISEFGFFFFFFPRVSLKSVLKLRATRTTRVFYTGEITALRPMVGKFF